MRSTTIAGLALAGTALLAACGGGANGYIQAAKTPARATTTVKVGKSRLGDILVDAGGRTLYGFANDAHGTSTCTGTCAQSWPPLVVGTDWKAGTGVDRANLHTITGADGRLRLVAGKWPLYRFAGDGRPGDVTGQGLEMFFVVRPDGTLLKAATVSTTTPPTSAPAMSGYGY